MDPLDPVRVGLDGITCAVCDGPVPDGSVELLARRDALAFLQVDCPVCRSTSVDIVDDGVSGPTEAAVTADDVLDMHAFLAGWSGDLAGLLEPRARTDPR